MGSASVDPVVLISPVFGMAMVYVAVCPPTSGPVGDTVLTGSRRAAEVLTGAVVTLPVCATTPAQAI